MVLAVVLVTSCGAPPSAATGPASTSRVSPTYATASSTPASDSRSQPVTPSPPPTPTVTCVPGGVPTSMLLIPGQATVLYDTSDPLHPHVVCRLTNTYARILTATAIEYLVPRPDGKTNVILHALGSNNESVETVVDADLPGVNVGYFYTPISMPPGSGVIAYAADGGTDANGSTVVDVWIAIATGRTKAYSYSVPGVDSFGRPGLPPPVLGLSGDAQYVIAGWALKDVGLHVLRLSDHADVTPPMPDGVRLGLWAPTGHTLYLVGSANVEAWSPETGVTTVTNTPTWILSPNFSPDGSQVAFTALTPSRDVRPYVYDLKAHSSRLLIDQPRSAVVFVKTGWIWDLEEKPCVTTDNNNCFDPTQPDGNVLAFNLATGQESPVVFGPGEAPSSAPGYTYLVPGDLWPRT